MEQRDFIQREIEKIGLMLLAILGRLRMVTSRKQFEEERVLVEADIFEIVGVSIEEILLMAPGTLVQKLNEDSRFNEKNMEYLAESLSELSDVLPEQEAEKSTAKELEILQWLDRTGKTFSFERQSRIAILLEKM